MKIKEYAFSSAVDCLSKIFYKGIGIEKAEESIYLYGKKNFCAISASNPELQVTIGVFGADNIVADEDFRQTIDADGIKKKIAAVIVKKDFLDICEKNEKVAISGSGEILIDKKGPKKDMINIPKKGILNFEAEDLVDSLKANAIASNAKAIFGLESQVQISFSVATEEFVTKSSDGKILCRAEIPFNDYVDDIKDFSYVISSSAADAIASIFDTAKEYGSIEMSLIEKGDEKWIGLYGKNVLIAVKTTVNEKYPSFQKILDVPFTRRFVVNKKEFVNLVGSAYKTITREEAYKSHLAVSDGIVAITTNNLSKSIRASEDSSSIACDLNVALLLSMCQIIQAPEVSVWLSEDGKLFKITPECSEGVVMIAATLNQ